MKLSLPGFYCFFLEGVFYSRDSKLYCQGEDALLSLEEYLLPLDGKEVDFFLSHRPPIPVQEERWGGGSCLWEPSGSCPAGHHNVPSMLLKVKERGVFNVFSGGYLLKTPRNTVKIPFEMLEGHSAVVTAVHFSEVDVGTLEASQIESLSKMMEKLKGFQI